ncbi:MAG TPA: F0F1 ATP synthase subunit B' [Acetobacteraceae bacterium]|nr:F0F1 ATP synthase subunit B' [Acetobacteraceae bacterium]
MRLLLAASVSLGLLLPAAAMAEGMPQLNFANPLTTRQLIWGAVIFVVFYVLAKGSALPRVASVLEERANHIARDLQNAQDAKDKSDKAAAEVAAATAKARSEAQAAINAALDKAKAEASAQAAALNARLEKQLQESEATIAEARSTAMGALRQVATETAATVITRLTGAAPESTRLDGAIGAALSARGVG